MKMSDFVLYHGTRGKNLSKILKHGLLSSTYRRKNPNYMLTTDIRTAKPYAGRESRLLRAPVVLEFHIPEKERGKYLHRGVASGWGDRFYAPKRPIPPRFINKVYEVHSGRVRVKQSWRKSNA